MNFNRAPQHSNEKVKARCWQVGGTDKAYLLSSQPKGKGGRQSWVPRSAVDHVTRYPAGVGQWPECLVTMPLWLALEKGLL